jgi:hypothetical protein
MPPILKRQGQGLFLVLAVTELFVGACNPYERRSGEYSAGSVDPIKFPPAYLGAGGRSNRAGMGTFQYLIAYVDGKPVIYYPLAFNGQQPKQLYPDNGDPNFDRSLAQIDLNFLARAWSTGGRSLPLTYVFDPKPTDTAPDSDKCIKPDGYAFDRQRDDVRYDRQGNVFTRLPIEPDAPAGTVKMGSTTQYVPIVREVVVSSGTNPCQDIKSEATLVQRTDISVVLDPPPEGVVDAKPTGHPSDRHLAYAIIDPAADVQPPSCPADGECECPPDALDLCKLDPITGLGPQRWGWFGQYLLAYLDGGVIPIAAKQPDGVTGAKVAKTQRLFYPLVWNEDDMVWEDQGHGLGRDVFDAKRGQDGYSPICELWTFEPASMNLKQSELKVSEIDVVARHPERTGKYIYCLQTP